MQPADQPWFRSNLPSLRLNLSCPPDPGKSIISSLIILKPSVFSFSAQTSYTFFEMRIILTSSGANSRSFWRSEGKACSMPYATASKTQRQLARLCAGGAHNCRQARGMDTAIRRPSNRFLSISPVVRCGCTNLVPETLVEVDVFPARTLRCSQIVGRAEH